MRVLTRIAIIATIGLIGSEAAAQAAARAPVTIVPRGGYMRFAERSSIKPSAFGGFEILYRPTSWIQLGPSVTIAQPNTNGDDFPVAFQYGDTTFLFRARQPLTMLDVGLSAHATLPVLGRLAPYAVGGVGYYNLYLDPQSTGADKRYGRMSLQVGGGTDVRVSDRAGIRLEVRDLIFSNFNRDRLNPVNQAQFDAYQRFSTVLPVRTASKRDSWANNIQFSIGFTFSPSLGRDSEDNQ